MSLTWVWLKLSFQLKTNPGAHVQSQTQGFEFDLSWTRGQTPIKNKAGAHVQSRTQVFEFDLSLTKIQYSSKNQSKTTCSKSNSIF